MYVQVEHPHRNESRLLFLRKMKVQTSVGWSSETSLNLSIKTINPIDGILYGV